jgi:hypothetical protein
MRLRKALAEARAEVVLLDGIGVARLVLPLLQNIPRCGPRCCSMARRA